MTSPGYTPYTTAMTLTAAKPSWVNNDLDKQRLAAYELYEKIYWTVPTVFALSWRGSENAPIYIPTARTVIEATNRYTCANFDVVISSSIETATENIAVTAAEMVLRDFMAREKFKSKFSGAKRYSLIHGDWVWHLTANPAKAEGSRISIDAIDPGQYFPVFDPDDVDRVIACHLVEQARFNDKDVIKRLTYRRIMDEATGVTKGISRQLGYFDLKTWESLEAEPVEDGELEPITPMPDEIMALPVYHVKNFDEPGNPFGSSEIRGFERLMAAINQTISDEDLSLAIDGLGMYATDAPHPTDKQGNELPWALGPGRVLHRPEGTFFERVSGVSGVTPYGDHYDRMVDALHEGSSVPDIAIGRVDVAVAQSGVALQLHLGPMLSKAAEKNQLIIDTHNQLFYDLLTMWYPAYESTKFDDIIITCVPGDAVPINRTERISELNDMLDKGVIDAQYYRDEMTKLGYEFPSDIGDRVDAESTKKADAAADADPFAKQLNATEETPPVTDDVPA